MKNKNIELLNSLAQDISKLLDHYIAIHDQRLKEASSFMSLFRKVNFKGIYITTKFLLSEFEELSKKLHKVKADNYQSFEQKEREYFDALLSYFNALMHTANCLFELAEAQYNRSENKGPLSWSENQKLESQYKSSINNYLSYGGKLNALYDLINRPINE